MTRFFLFLTFLFPLLGQADSRPVRVACIGNSITYGMGIAQRDSLSYPAQLQRKLGKGFLVGNFGHSGATLLRRGHLPYVSTQAYRDALNFKADVAVIHLGINDTDPRNWPNHGDDFVRDYLSLIDTLRSVNPKVRILIARLTPIGAHHRRFASGTKLWHGLIQQRIATVARVAQVQLIDFHRALADFPQLIPDALHPNAEGAGRLAEEVYRGITGQVGGLHLSPLYADGMVLQRGTHTTLRGEANAGTPITVRLGKERATTTADANGRWSVSIALPPVGEGYTLEVKAGRERRSFKDVAVGEVWLCSGQSNMEFKLHESDTYAQDTLRANDKGLRLYNMECLWSTGNHTWTASAIDSVAQLHYYRPTTWQYSTARSASRFSAVAYHFGRMLRDSLQVPIGLICNAVGGSTTESWIDRDTLETAFPAMLTDWTRSDYVMDWARGRALTNLAQQKGTQQRHPYAPGYLYAAGIRPLLEQKLAGVLWYQGESNAHNIELHEQLFPLLIDTWRKRWQQPTLPFLFVQLSSLNRPSWPAFRDSQRRMAQQLKGVAMAVSSDHGHPTDVHPRHKATIGQRLARLALPLYKDRAVRPVSPTPMMLRTDGQRGVLLHIEAHDGLTTSDGQPMRSFEVADEEGLFYPAQVELLPSAAGQSGQVVLRLSASEVKHPRIVRYGWQPYSQGNVVDGAGSPLSTFRLELAP